MDQIKKLSAGHSIEVLDAIMTEVEEARGEHESLDARLDEISGEGYSKAEVDALLALKQNALNSAQLAAVNSGINSEKVEQIETNKNNILLKANTSDVNTATANLQAQIDNIVSGSTADSEVINARVGADGTSYNTLKARLDGEITEVQGDIEEIQEALYIYRNAAFTDNCYITTSGIEVTLNPYGYPDETNNVAWETFYCGCKAGMKYILTGAGGSNPRLWAFANSDWEIISVSEASARATNQVIIAPENAEYIIINNDKRIVNSASLTTVEDTYEDIKQLAASISGTLLELIDNKNIASSGTEILVDENNVPITASSTNYVCYYGECTGKHYKISGYGGFNPRLFAFADENWEILNNAYANQIAENLIITPPSNAKYVIFNFNKTHDYLAEVIGEVTKIRILSYNVGNFAGTGYTTGSDDLAIEYRRAVADSNPQIVFAQEDVAYYNQQQTLSRDEVFGMFNFYRRTGNTDFNYKSFASDYVINNIAQVNYQTTGLSHTYFLTGDLTINGKTIKLVNVHLDWADVTRRGHQIDEVIAYCNNYPYVIIAGDMNPSVRVNGEFPEGSSHEDNFFRYDDYTKWTNEGYKIANAGYFGAFCTDLTYPAPTGKKWSTDKSDFACWDNIIVSGNINIKNVGIVAADYMNDHAPIWADLEIG